MTMRLKFSGPAADELFADAVWKPLNSSTQIDVIPEERQAMVMENERSEDREREAAMSLGELLYYVLAGEGKIADEPT